MSVDNSLFVHLIRKKEQILWPVNEKGNLQQILNMEETVHPVSLLLFCGIPAAGKTSCAKLIQELGKKLNEAQGDRQSGRYLRIIHIAYDELIPDNLHFEEVKESVESSQWKLCRSEIVKWMDKLLGLMLHQKLQLSDCASKMKTFLSAASDSGSVQKDVREKLTNVLCRVLQEEKPILIASGDLPSETSGSCVSVVFLLDDNFFYRSMRYQFYQLARKYSIGFGQVCLECSLKVALIRNKKRTTPIREDTIAAMTRKLELPDSTKAPWETHYFVINSEQDYDHDILCQVLILIMQTLSEPAPPLMQEDMEEKEYSRTLCTSSTLHQADIVLRKCVSSAIQKAKESANQSPVELKQLASKLNNCRTQIFENIKDGTVSLPPLELEEDAMQSKNTKFAEVLNNWFIKLTETT